ncbi:DUF5715 family protein [Bacteroides ihuae]|uniref:DUF5715 family protein n=1 Tax=Bacteroides ihuae TaxID=1852362 RepID=UPI000ACDFBC7|nr:DUF5715 family protein [Bacteroides ihuae]
MRKLKPRYRNLAYLLFLVLFIAVIVLVFPSSKKDMSLRLNNPRNIHGVISYKRSFGDLNDVQLVVARANGIVPLNDRDELEALGDKLIHLSDNNFYTIDSLTHSIPYLVPRASNLLDSIGSIFLDSLESKGLNPNRIVVTSILRTRDDVNRLRRRNGNASENSAHFYGTTFDVSWKRFTKVEDEGGRPFQDVSSDTLKLVLSEVLSDMRLAEKCYVKYELKQGCFHITAR